MSTLGEELQRQAPADFLRVLGLRFRVKEDSFYGVDRTTLIVVGLEEECWSTRTGLGHVLPVVPGLAETEARLMWRTMRQAILRQLCA